MKLNNKTLICIDMQEGFRSKELESIIPTVKILLNEFNGNKIFAKFRNEKGSQFERLLGWTKFQSYSDQRIIEELENYNFDEISHTGYTVLTSENLNMLHENKTAEIYLAGIYTDICVIKTAMDAIDKGFRVKIIIDACASLHGKRSHECALDSLRHIVGETNMIISKVLK